ncbi:ABC transporter permease [Methylobacterium radiodurans]|uniref:Putrescine ABC transporter permease PotH n=1 Tax=Methylobacterium radiodurans TaxID=2202828 RepID=A0A2U8VND6_9HYPH|nr:ABC transporter permease subunit [Methylobacterium radiodurans]AWN35117.1 putrescine ABC transporter permease PotH [Methylobacterium radiodurans]
MISLSPPRGAPKPASRTLHPRLARLPALLWLVAFFLVPFLITLKISLSEPATAIPPYRPTFDWRSGVQGLPDFLGALGLSNYEMLAADPYYWNAALSSISLAFGGTTLLVCLGIPLAHALTRAPARWRSLLVALMIVPFWTSFLVRVYAWIAILKPEGLLNAGLIRLGLIGQPLEILNTPTAVLIGLVYAYLPFMVLPLYAVMSRLDPTLHEAAADLGAGPTRVFWTVSLPLSAPGLFAGALLCFIPMMGEFVIPDLLGGSDTLMLGRALWSEFFSNRDWPFASAVAVLLVLILVGPVVLLRQAESRREAVSP